MICDICSAFFTAKNGHPIAHTLTDAYFAFVDGSHAVVVAEIRRFLPLRDVLLRSPARAPLCPVRRSRERADIQ